MYTCYIKSFKILKLASLAEHAGLKLTCSKIPEDTFSHDVAHPDKAPPSGAARYGSTLFVQACLFQYFGLQ